MTDRQMTLDDIYDRTIVRQRQSQCERLLRHFRNGGTLTSFEAYLKFGITQLGRCISDLEGEGHRFNRPRVRLENGKIVCRYSIRKVGLLKSRTRKLRRKPKLWSGDSMSGGGGWGNSIKFTDRISKKGEGRIVGWKTPKPKDGDYLQVRMESGRIGVFKMGKIEQCGDPHDMFFADVKIVGYKDEIEKVWE